MVDKFYDVISETIVDSISNPNTNYYYDKYNNQEKYNLMNLLYLIKDYFKIVSVILYETIFNY